LQPRVDRTSAPSAGSRTGYSGPPDRVHQQCEEYRLLRKGTIKPLGSKSASTTDIVMTVSEVVAGLTVNKSKFERFRGAETARTALPIRQNRSRVHLHQKHQKSNPAALRRQHDSNRHASPCGPVRLMATAARTSERPGSSPGRGVPAKPIQRRKNHLRI
jgi:hypothetical protein